MIPAWMVDAIKRKSDEDDEKRRLSTQLDLFDDGPDDFDDDEDEDFDDDDDNDDDDEDEAEVLQSKGSSPPAQPSPMAESNAQINLERARAEIAAQEAQRQRERDAVERQALIQKASGIQNQAYNQAAGYDDLQIRARGFDQGLVDQYGLADLYNDALNTARLGISETDLNPMASYNTKTMFNDALETAQGTYRGDLRKQLNQIAPEDFAYNLFSDTADDSILQAILDSGRADALATIDQAKARGQLNDVGYGRAMSKLDQQGQAAMADLQDLGLGVLSGYRDDLGALRTDYLGRANTASFADPLNFDTFQNILNTRVGDYNNRLSGDIYRAVGDQSFFDPNTIISGSGALQGFYNPTSTSKKSTSSGTSNPLLDAFTSTEDEKKKTNTTGVF